MASWRGPGSISEPPGLDFGGSGALLGRFWKALGLLFDLFLENLWVPHLGTPANNCGHALLPSFGELPTLSNTTGQMSDRTLAVGFFPIGPAPFLKVSVEIRAKLAHVAFKNIIILYWLLF